MKGTLANNPNGANDAAVKGGLWPRMKNLINIVAKSKTYTFAGLNDMHGIVKCHVIKTEQVLSINMLKISQLEPINLLFRRVSALLQLSNIR